MQDLSRINSDLSRISQDVGRLLSQRHQSDQLQLGPSLERAMFNLTKTLSSEQEANRKNMLIVALIVSFGAAALVGIAVSVLLNVMP